jgi:hypothetical protein
MMIKYFVQLQGDLIAFFNSKYILDKYVQNNSEFIIGSGKLESKSPDGDKLLDSYEEGRAYPLYPFFEAIKNV